MYTCIVMPKKPANMAKRSPFGMGDSNKSADVPANRLIQAPMAKGVWHVSATAGNS